VDLPASKSKESVGAIEISERHRHRYEVNPEFIENFSNGGLVFSGTSPDGKLMEIAELPRDVHPFFLGTQFHPEFKSRPLKPHPLFTEFLKTSIKRGGELKNKKIVKIEKEKIEIITRKAVDNEIENKPVELSF